MPDHLRPAKPSFGTLEAQQEEDPESKLQAAWLNSCIRSLMELSPQKAAKPQKERLATYWFLVALDHVLRCRTGQGLEAMSSPQTVAAVAKLLGAQCTEEFKSNMPALLKSQRFEYQFLGLVIDQCSVGLSGQLAAKRLFHLYIEGIYDPAHLRCNAILNGLKQAGQYYLILVMKVMYGINHACFGTGKWFTEAQDFLKAMLAEHRKDIKVLWDFMLPSIRNDMGLKDATLSDSFSEALLESLWEDVFQHKGPKLQICEWGAWVTATKYWDVRFHRRSFVLTLLGLEKGLFSAKTLSRQSQLQTLTKKLDACGGGGGKKVQEKVQKDLASVGRNTLHCGIRLYAEGWVLQRAIRGIFHLALPLHEKYQSMRQDAKSTQGMLEYYRGMAGSAAFEPLTAVFGKLVDLSVLQKLGLLVSPADLPLVALTGEESSSLLDDEEQWCKKLGFTACHCCLVGKSLASCLWHQYGLPGLLPAILDIDLPQSQNVRAFLQQVQDWYENAGQVAHRSPELQKQLGESFLQDPIPQKCMQVLKGVNFQCTPDHLQNAIRGIFSSGQTVANEQANRAARDLEERAQDNKVVSNERLLLAPIKAGVLSKQNRFQEVTYRQWNAQHGHQASIKKITQEIFTPKADKVLLPLKCVQGEKKEAPYATGTPASLNKSFCHIMWWKHITKVDADVELTSRLWLTELLPLGEVVRWKVTGELGLVVLHVEHRAAVAWPVMREQIGSQEFFTPRCDLGDKAAGRMMFFFCVNPEQFEVFRTD